MNIEDISNVKENHKISKHQKEKSRNYRAKNKSPSDSENENLKNQQKKARSRSKSESNSSHEHHRKDKHAKRHSSNHHKHHSHSHSSKDDRTREKIGYDKPYRKDERVHTHRDRRDNDDDRKFRKGSPRGTRIYDNNRNNFSGHRRSGGSGKISSGPYPNPHIIKYANQIRKKPEDAIKKTLELVESSSQLPNALENEFRAPSIPLPSYYNPQTVDPIKYAERMQKRKLLWSSKKQTESSADTLAADEKEDSTSPSTSTTNLYEDYPTTTKSSFVSSSQPTFPPITTDNKPLLPPTNVISSQEVNTAASFHSKPSMAAVSSAPVIVPHKTITELYWQQTAFEENSQTEKFRKLMGMKKKTTAAMGPENKPNLVEGPNDHPKGSESAVAGPVLTEEEKKRRQEMLEKLNQQYEIARMSTHTMRGMGLGFASSAAARTNFDI